MKKTLFIACVCSGLIFPSTILLAASPAPDCAAFNRNLKIGMKGADVTLLQQLLNVRRETQVSTDGSGSPGNETDYFGLKTARAVALLQQLNAKEVLSPLGLSQGTGYVGALTRSLLMRQCQERRAPATQTERPTTTTPAAVPTTTPAASQLPAAIPSNSIESAIPVMGGMRTDILHIKYPSSYSVGVGGQFTIYGGGFASSSNTVHIGDVALTGLQADASGNLIVTVPSGVTYGDNELWVSNEKGSTPKQFIVVMRPNSLPPTIATSTPAEGFYGATVTITGTGFSPSGNDIHTSYGIVHNVTSQDGRTLAFQVLPPIPGLAVGEDRPEFTISAPVGFFVVNENGMSNENVFTLKI